MFVTFGIFSTADYAYSNQSQSDSSRYVAIQLIERPDIICDNYANCGWGIRVAKVGQPHEDEELYSARINWGENLDWMQYRELVRRHRRERGGGYDGRSYETKDWYCAKILQTVYPRYSRIGHKTINLYQSPSSSKPNLYNDPSACYCIKSNSARIPKLRVRPPIRKIN